MPHSFPEFRGDLEVTPYIVEGKRLGFLVKDTVSEEMYEFGDKEYFICRHLNGSTGFEELKLSFENHFGTYLSPEYLEAFTRKLQSSGLLESSSDEFNESQRLKPPTKMIPMGNPDRWLGFVANWLNWCFSRYLFVALLFFSIIAFGTLLKYFADILYQIWLLKLAWWPILYLLIILLGIFVIDPLAEFTKGITCKHFGRYVSECGIVIKYRIFPRFYMGLSDAIWMPEKGDRLRVFSAGLLCRLLLWTIGVFAWKNATAGSSIETFWLLFIIASTFAFVLTLVPLTERDGYYLLCIWMKVDDLRDRAVDLAKAWILRKPLPEPLSFRNIMGFKWFGVLWVCFQVLFWGLLLGFGGYFLTTTLKGVGALITLAIVYCRFGYLLNGMLKGARPARKILMNHSPAFIRLRLLVKYGLLIVLIVVALLPYPFMAGGDFSLLPVKQAGIRSHVTGEIETVFVTEGQWVEKGDPVVKLTGREQKKKIEATQAGLDQAQARLDLLRQGPKPEAIAAARQEVQTTAKSLEYSTLSADRYAKLIKDNATSAQAYENALKVRDLDRERLKLAKRNLELVSSGARKEEIEAVEAEVRRLQVELRHAEEDLELTILTSPIGGRIITPKLSQTIGQVLVEGDMFAVVEDSRKIIAEIEVPEEDVGEVNIGAAVTLRAWGYPSKAFKGKVVAIAPVAYEKSLESVKRTLSEREQLYGRTQTFREEGKVVRVLSEFPNEDGFLKTDMTGYAKIDSKNMPVIVAFTRWLVRFIMIEVWSWIP